jgi:hypothetical protein
VDLGALFEYRFEHFIRDQLAIERHDDVVNLLLASRSARPTVAKRGSTSDIPRGGLR